MRTRVGDLALTVLIAVAAACGNRPQGTVTAAGPEVAVAGTTTTPTMVPTTAPSTSAGLSATAILRSAVAIEPGARLALAPGAEAVVHPSSTFEVELSVRAPDARLVLVDAREDQMATAGTRELTPSRTRLTLAPSSALAPGSHYALRLDGATERELHDDAGRAFTSLTLPLLAAGTPPPPETKRPARRHRRR